MKKICSKLLNLNPNPNPLFPRFGFTLIEILLAVSITTILFTIGTAQYIKFNRQQILDQAVLELRTNLTQARNMALAGKKGCTGTFDGVLVEFNYGDENYTVYSSCDNKTDLTQIKFYELTRGVGLDSGPATILFKALTGGTDLNDTAVILLTGSSGAGGISVTPGGKIETVLASNDCDDNDDCTLDIYKEGSCHNIIHANGYPCEGGRCANGTCCQGCREPLGQCSPGTTGIACGVGGEVCVDCLSVGKICENGVCVNP